MCYCRQCIVDKNRPVAISTSATLKGNFAWQITRAFHLAGRCVGCDECYAGLPRRHRLAAVEPVAGQGGRGEFRLSGRHGPGGRAGRSARIREQDHEEFIR